MSSRSLAVFAAAALVTSALGGATTLVRAADTTVTISQGVDPVTMDPLKRTITPTTNVHYQIFDTLVRHDRDGKMVPWVATSWRRAAWRRTQRPSWRRMNGWQSRRASASVSVEPTTRATGPRGSIAA